MTTDNPSFAADPWGVHLRWIDAHERSQVIPAATVEALHDVIGQPPSDLQDTAPIVTRRGRDLGLGHVTVHCEDGQPRSVAGVVPADFPLGYHTVRTSNGHERTLIVSPGRCWLPEGWRAWGWTVQLYATRSADSWGMGDLGDLATVREWADGLGAGFLMINPLHAVAPTLPQEPSPYLPTTRRFLNPLYLRVEQVPNAANADLSDLGNRRRALRDDPQIDRDTVWRLKRDALWRIFQLGTADAGFARWRDERGSLLEQFATWSALAEDRGPDWREWQPTLRDPESAAVAGFAAENRPVVDFFAWLQWLAHRQLKDASADLTVIQDFPIGVDGGGFDAWSWRETLAGGVTVGAPPDIFAPNGQDWSSPPLIPWRLRAADYRPFIESIRATMAATGGLRIDHVMGLFRLWWVPRDGSPADGAYVRYPSDDLLDIVALESHRAKAIVVGEDLGTVEKGVRQALAGHAMLSYRLLWFEDDDPADWPVQAMATVTTHDLPTVAGLWSGADLEEQRQVTSVPPEELARGRDELLGRLRKSSAPPIDASPAEAVVAAYGSISRAPSTLIAATLEDAVGDERRPNMPGTRERPNWCLPLSAAVEDLPRHPLVSQVAALFDAGISSTARNARRSPGPVHAEP